MKEGFRDRNQLWMNNWRKHMSEDTHNLNVIDWCALLYTPRCPSHTYTVCRPTSMQQLFFKGLHVCLSADSTFRWSATLAWPCVCFQEFLSTLFMARVVIVVVWPFQQSQGNWFFLFTPIIRDACILSLQNGPAMK